MKWDTLLILRIHKLLQKKSILEKADNVNRGDRDKKAQQSKKSTQVYRWDVKLTPFGTPSSNLSKSYRHGVEITVKIRRRMKVQQLLRNEMLVQCSSEFVCYFANSR